MPHTPLTLHFPPIYFATSLLPTLPYFAHNYTTLHYTKLTLHYITSYLLVSSDYSKMNNHNKVEHSIHSRCSSNNIPHTVAMRTVRTVRQDRKLAMRNAMRDATPHANHAIQIHTR